MSEVQKLLEDDTIYQGSLTELVRIGLGEESSEMFVGQDSSKDIEDIEEVMVKNQSYIADLLEEEITSQFTDSKRPLIELVPNAIDARPNNADSYNIDIEYDGSKFNIKDQGESMNLDQILQSLVIPFSSDKDTQKTNIGQFGVGFLSNIQYTVNQGSEIQVKTNHENSAFNTKFWSDGSVRDIDTKITEAQRSDTGTEVTIDGLEFSQDDLNQFFTKYLQFVDPETAQINFNGEQINSQPEGAFTVKGDQAYNGFQPADSSRISIQESGEDTGELYLHSQGVLVESSGLETGYDVRIDFPSEVDLTEGRNKFLRDEALKSHVLNIVDNLTEKSSDEKEKAALRELIPQLMSKTHTRIKGLDDRNAEREFRETLVDNFLDMDYLIAGESKAQVSSMGYESLEGFFGEVPGDHYIPEDSTSKRFWDKTIREAERRYVEDGESFNPTTGVGDAQSLLEDFTTEVEPSQEVYELINQYTGSEHQNVTFVDPVNSEGDMPFVYDSDNEELYVNPDHYLIDPDNSMTKSMIQDRYREAVGMNESEIEDEVVFSV